MVKRKAAKKPDTAVGAHGIKKLNTRINSDLQISKKAVQVMESFMADVCERIMAEAVRLHRTDKAKTLSTRDIVAATRLVLQGELAKHAVAEGNRAVTGYECTC